MYEGKLEIMKTAYTLRATSHKRVPVYLPLHHDSGDLFDEVLCYTNPINYSYINSSKNEILIISNPTFNN